MSKADILFQTDFGMWGGASMYGMCKMVDPELRPYTLSHTVPVFDVKEGSRRLALAMGFWPEGTVFVSVVDPGVGTPRRAAVALTDSGHYVVTPDNGTLTDVRTGFGIKEIREIDERVNRYPFTPKVSIFHGRDLFAYCAARLASGIITYEQVGKAYPAEEVVTVKSDMLGFRHYKMNVDKLLYPWNDVMQKQPKHIVILNRFNYDGRFAMCRGICKFICPEAEVFDVQLPAEAGEMAAYWPEGTMFLGFKNGELTLLEPGNDEGGGKSGL